MAVQEFRMVSVLNKAVNLYVTFDDADNLLDPDIEAYRLTWDLPAGLTLRVNIYRDNGSLWRTTDLTGQGEYSDTKPFGPVKKKNGLRWEVVGV